MSEKHTPEPWVAIDPYTGCDGTEVNGGVFNEDDGAPECLIGEFHSRVDALRATACVNACADIPTAALEAGTVAKLVEACRAVNEHLWKTFPPSPDGASPFEKVRAALASLEKQP